MRLGPIEGMLGPATGIGILGMHESWGLTVTPRRDIAFAGFQRPNYTMVPDELFDELLPDLTGAELKVLLYIVRRTFGFKKDSDNISLSQMMNGIRTRDGRVLDRGVGLTKKTVLGALRSLEGNKIIVSQRRQSVERGNEPTEYRLNIVNTTRNGHQGTLGGETTLPLGENLTLGAGPEITPSPRSNNYASQETEQQETVGHLSNIRMVSDKPQTGSESGNGEKRERSRDSGGREMLAAFIEGIATEFRDQAPLRSTVTRLLRLYERSELTSLTEFVDVLYQARTISRKHTGAVRAGEPGARIIMPYFLAVTEDLLGLTGADERTPT